ncbi:MAG: hypothetical protein WBM90_00900 [Acidimicrobiia bacterium]
MQTKNVLYAAVGAPVVAARKVSGKVSDQVNTIKGRVGEEKANYTEVAQKAIDEWAVEGEKVVSKVSEKKVVEEISSKVDLDQAKEQVSKLRDQLEDMLATWRSSFRPEKSDDAGDPSEKTAAKSTPASKPAAKKPAAKKPAAKSTESKATEAEKPATESQSAKTAKTSTEKTEPDSVS